MTSQNILHIILYPNYSNQIQFSLKSQICGEDLTEFVSMYLPELFWKSLRQDQIVYLANAGDQYEHVFSNFVANFEFFVRSV